jgi:predicted DNA-binding transcriptional regulator AlpA
MKLNKESKALAESFPTCGYVRDKQVAAFCAVSRTTVWRMAKSGRLPKPIKLSSRVTVWKAEEVIKSVGGAS